MYLNQTVALVSRLPVPNVRMLLAVQQNHSKVCLNIFLGQYLTTYPFASNAEVCLTLPSAGINACTTMPRYDLKKMGVRVWRSGQLA